MDYVIMSGRFEKGTDEQKQGYVMLFGEDNIQYKFDLYFHWYNLVHELGHCIKNTTDVEMSDLMEEMFVNEFAVGYHRMAGDSSRLDELEEMIQNALNKLPSPVLEGEDFISFYERIWGTEELMNVMTYGYLQLSSVLQALKNKKDLSETLSKLNISIDRSVKLMKCNLSVSSENAPLFLDAARDNLIKLGVEVPSVRIELQDNPEIQCARCC